MSSAANTQTIMCGSCTIIIRRPELTPAEQKKRQQTATDTIGRVLRDYYRRKDSKT